MELIPDLLLRECADFDFASPPFDPVVFAQQLVKMMIDNQGLGLAANQVAVPYRVFAMFTQPQNTVCFNPRIVDFGDEEIALEEGCLSYPGMFLKLKRPKNIRVRFQQPNGDTRTEKYTGMASRVFQHELDHLNGLPFWHSASRIQFDRARKHYTGKGYVLFNGKIHNPQTIGEFAKLTKEIVSGDDVRQTMGHNGEDQKENAHPVQTEETLR